MLRTNALLKKMSATAVSAVLVASLLPVPAYAEIKEPQRVIVDNTEKTVEITDDIKADSEESALSVRVRGGDKVTGVEVEAKGRGNSDSYT